MQFSDAATRGRGSRGSKGGSTAPNFVLAKCGETVTPPAAPGGDKVCIGILENR